MKCISSLFLLIALCGSAHAQDPPPPGWILHDAGIGFGYSENEFVGQAADEAFVMAFADANRESTKAAATLPANTTAEVTVWISQAEWIFGWQGPLPQGVTCTCTIPWTVTFRPNR